MASKQKRPWVCHGGPDWVGAGESEVPAVWHYAKGGDDSHGNPMLCGKQIPGSPVAMANPPPPGSEFCEACLDALGGAASSAVTGLRSKAAQPEYVWIRDINRRERDVNGKSTERGHWFKDPVTKVGRINIETQSGLVLDRATLEVKRGGGPGVWGVVRTEEEMENAVYVAENKHKLVRALEDCRDAATLRRIAAILNGEG